MLGITPEIKASWTDDDTLRFMTLIQSKNLVSIIKKQEINNAIVKGIVLSVELVDTSGDEDVDIAELFNNKKQNENQIF